jgi:hypothetical protein
VAEVEHRLLGGRQPTAHDDDQHVVEDVRLGLLGPLPKNSFWAWTISLDRRVSRLAPR